MSDFYVLTMGDVAQIYLKALNSSDWVVHSSFNSACNIITQDGRLVSIQNIGTAVSPLSLIIDSSKPLNLLFPVGSAVHTCCEQSIVISHTKIFYDYARIFKSHFENYNSLLLFPDSCYNYLLSILKHQKESICQSSVWQLRQLCLRRLKAAAIALCSLDSSAFFTAAQQLIGLGPGLTPSGDDMLSGICAAARFYPPYARIIETTIQKMDFSSHTTKLSSKLLELTLEGYYAESLIILLTSLVHDDLPAFIDGCHIMLSTGSYTGTDCLLGFYYALWSLKVNFKNNWV